MSSVTYLCPCPNPLTGAFSDSDKQSDPHDVSTTSSDIGVDRDSSSGSTISAADSNTTTTTSALPSLKYPDNWVRQGGESGIYKVTIIVVMSLFIAAAVCCCIAIAVLWRRRRKRARQMAHQRDLEKRRAVEGSDGEYDEMDEEGGSEAGCCERRLGESKEERRRRRKAELARLAQRDGDVEDDEEHREKKRWARASARWKSHVRWIRRRRTGNKRILESMMQRDAAASSVSVFSPSLQGNDTGVDAADSLRDSSLARRRPVVGTHSEAHIQPSSSSSISSGSHSARSLTTSVTSTSPIDVSAIAVRTPSPYGQGGGNTQFAMRQQGDEHLPPSGADANTRNGARTAADLAPVNSIDPSGPQAHAVVHEYDSFPPPPANPRSGARRAVRASVDSACTYDRPPPNSPPLDLTSAQSLSASSTEATPATGNQNCSLGSDQDQSRNSDTENDDDLHQRPPAYRSRWRGSRSGNISEEEDEADGYSEDDISRRRARRNEKSASGSGYALYAPGTGGDGPNVLHVATDDKRVLARLTEAASAPPASPMAPSFPSEPLSVFPPTTIDSDHAHATAPAAPEWEDDVAFYDNLDSPGAGPSNSQSSFLPAPPKAVSSSLAFTSLIPPPSALEASSFAADLAFSTSSLSSISGCVPGGSGGDAFIPIPMGTPGPSNPPSSPSPWRPQQFSRYTFAEEELFGAEPEAGPSAPPFTDDAGEDTGLEEASAPPLFEDEDAFADEGLEERTITDSPVNRRPDGSANSVEERAIPPAAVR